MTGDTDRAFTTAAFVLLFGVLLLAAGGYLYYSETQATANAEPVNATVLDTNIVETGDVEEGEEYSVVIRYRYTYDGETYTTRNLCPGRGASCEPSSDSRSDMEEFLEDYEVGSTVTAYVPPSDPGDGYLLQRSRSLIYLGLIAGGLVSLLVGVWLLWSNRE